MALNTWLTDILKGDENEFVEFKSSFNVETIESLVAFANRRGGAVLLGVTRGKVTGVMLSPESIQQWLNEIKGKTEPPIIPDVEVVDIQGRQVVVFRIADLRAQELPRRGIAAGGMDFCSGDETALTLDLVFHFRTLDRSTAWIGDWPAPTLPVQIAPVDTQAWLQYEDSTQGRRALLHPLVGLSYRNGLTGPTVTSRGRTDLEATVVEGGGILRADAPDFHAWGDARIIVERQEPFPHSYDGQFIEPSEEGDNSIATFTSFARFEGRMTLDTRLGRFGAGRTRQHWGPAYQYPLVLGQWTQPYSHVDWSMEWGPFRIRTLWAQLSTDGAGRFRSDTATRSLYAHRYEWSPTRWLDLGATEALILYKTQEPLAFVPVVPLFMMKGQSVEGYANGELAFDAQVRPLDGWRLYGEFMIDDMSEPASLFNDFWKNKWAVTVGSHAAITPLPGLETGLITELSRVEPWVYTEYVPRSNQAEHQGLPLGNPNGPNSLSVGGTGYAAWRGATLSVGVDWVRKGTDSGSAISDLRAEASRAKKEFLVQSRNQSVFKIRIAQSFYPAGMAWIEIVPSAKMDQISRQYQPRACSFFHAGVIVSI